MDAIDRLYSNVIYDLDYKELPETEEARRKLKAAYGFKESIGVICQR